MADGGPKEDVSRAEGEAAQGQLPVLDEQDAGDRQPAHAESESAPGAEEPAPDSTVPAGEADSAADQSAERLINASTEALASGAVARALALARQAVEQAPELAAAWALLGMVAEEAAELREALEAYRRCEELEPGRAGIADRIADLEGRVPAETEQEEAEEAVQEQAAGLERYAPALLAFSVALLVLALGLALVLRSRQTTSLERSYQAAMEQGTKLMALQDFDRAEAAFTEALRLKPGDPQALAWLQRARKNRERLAEFQQWQYRTMGGKFPGVTGGSPLPPAKITPTAERKAQQAQAQAGSTASGTRRSSPRRYTWRGSTTQWQPTGVASNFPSPRQEYGSGLLPEQGAAGVQFPPTQPTGAATAPGYGSPQPVMPSQPGSAAAATTGAAGTGMQGGAGTATAGAGQAAEESPPKGYMRITVGEPKKTSGSTASGPSADQLRSQADAARQAGKTAEACELYRKAAELYKAEAQADPQTREVKQAAADYCRRASQQCEQQ